jgi:mono/diheme cytochrome c family protein
LKNIHRFPAAPGAFLRKPFAPLSVAAACLALAPLASAFELPPGKGREIINKACTQCHDLDPITQQRHSRADWKGIVDSMKEMGATATPAEFNEIIDYLGMNYGPQSGGAASSADSGSKKEAPVTPLRPVPWEKNRLRIGQALYRENCVVCHDVDAEKSKKIGPSFYHVFQGERMPRTNVKPSRNFVVVKVRIGGQVMPAFAQKLTARQIDALVDYMQSK